MKKTLFALALTCILISCAKEDATEDVKDPTVPESEFEALKQEVESLKAKIDTLTPVEIVTGFSLEEFNALKTENNELKAKVANLMSTFFEVDGLRFDKNGDVISVPKIESSYKQVTSSGTLTMTRTFDVQGRLLQTYGKYSDYNSLQYPPYYWQKKSYEYNGKTVKIKTESESYATGVEPRVETTEVTYW